MSWTYRWSVACGAMLMFALQASAQEPQVPDIPNVPSTPPKTLPLNKIVITETFTKIPQTGGQNQPSTPPPPLIPNIIQTSGQATQKNKVTPAFQPDTSLPPPPTGLPGTNTNDEPTRPVPVPGAPSRVGSFPPANALPKPGRPIVTPQPKPQGPPPPMNAEVPPRTLPVKRKPMPNPILPLSAVPQDTKPPDDLRPIPPTHVPPGTPAIHIPREMPNPVVPVQKLTIGAKATSSPWVLRVEILTSGTHLYARNNNTELHVVCKKLKMQSPGGEISAEENVVLTAAGVKVKCERVVISWANDWVMLTGTVHLVTERDGQRLEMTGEELRLRLTTLNGQNASEAARTTFRSVEPPRSGTLAIPTTATPVRQPLQTIPPPVTPPPRIRRSRYYRP